MWRIIKKAHFPPKMERVHSKTHATSVPVIIKVFVCSPVFVLTEDGGLEVARMIFCDVLKDRENVCDSTVYCERLHDSSHDSEYTHRCDMSSVIFLL
jgi:hypothetical protein